MRLRATFQPRSTTVRVYGCVSPLCQVIRSREALRQKAHGRSVATFSPLRVSSGGGEISPLQPERRQSVRAT